MAINEETLARLKNEHGEITVLGALGYEIAVKSPGRAAFDRFMATSAKGKEHAHRAFANLVIDSLVHPSRDEWTAIVDAKPGLVVTFGSEVAKIAGLVDEVEAKKA